MELAQTLEAYDYPLPEGAIAHAVARPRDHSRLLVLRRAQGESEHHRFWELPQLLQPGDLLVVNATKVLPARLRLARESGGKVELLPFRPVDGGVETARCWEALGSPGRVLKAGRVLMCGGVARVVVEGREGEVVRVRCLAGPLWELMAREGEVPLPPYIRRVDGVQASDQVDYQTIFAAELGSVAAPTASLHFTEGVLDGLVARGVQVEKVVLHVGPGTFLPVRDECAADVRRHQMHAEWYEVPQRTVEAVAATRARGGRVVAVGTTSVRALESWGKSGAVSGLSALFIYPGFEFRVVDAMVTNFHLPRSTLLMLVAAFAGRERVLAAYQEALAAGYRFFSYGDAMLLC